MEGLPPACRKVERRRTGGGRGYLAGLCLYAGAAGTFFLPLLDFRPLSSCPSTSLPSHALCRIHDKRPGGVHRGQDTDGQGCGPLEGFDLGSVPCWSDRNGQAPGLHSPFYKKTPTRPPGLPTNDNAGQCRQKQMKSRWDGWVRYLSAWVPREERADPHATHGHSCRHHRHSRIEFAPAELPPTSRASSSVRAPSASAGARYSTKKANSGTKKERT